MISFSVIWTGVIVVIDFLVDTNFTWFLVLIIISNPILLSPLGCRIILNMREASEHGINAGTSCGVTVAISTTVSQDVPDTPGQDGGC